MGRVVKLKLVDLTRRGRVETGKVLRGAVAAKLARVVVIGEHDDGRTYVASTDGPEQTVWDIEFAKKWLLDGCPEQDVDG